MIILRTEILKMWLRTIRRSQSWLAKELGFTKGYISQIVNNRCKLSREVIEGLLRLTNFQFEHLFQMDGRPDTREFYGDVFVVDGKPMQKRAYFDTIRSKQIFIDTKPEVVVERKGQKDFDAYQDTPKKKN